ncbi:MAG TPA: FAD-binding oxidoreductase [Geminicoccaceae bacterium]|nr:FAD-binding oxidoreductase [Geminicoccus sp.]HMU52995.1 FAD-binding oxidoreductase [Geminicoccaceae bacterium]
MIEELRAELDGIATESDPASLRIKSRDFFWFSPILKPRLEGREAELIVMPANREELARVAAGCVRHRVPLTVRGGGTGNYGQAVPLAGGIVLDMTRLDRVLNVQPGMGRFEAGARLLEIDRQLRPERWELRFFPSTRKVATIGGFLAGGAGGVGSCTWGQLADPGAVLAARVLTVEEQPRLIELRGREALKVAHAYGVNGIITEVEMPLAPWQPWAERIFAFPSFDAAMRFGHALTAADGIARKLVTVLDGRIPPLIRRLNPLVPPSHSVALVMVTEPQAFQAEDLAADQDGEVVFARGHEQTEAAAFAGDSEMPPIYEFAWNHTTLHALRRDPSITYLQVRLPAGRELELAMRLHDDPDGELMLHFEFQRRFGRVFVSGLPLLRFRSAEHLAGLTAGLESMGIELSNPHTSVLDDAGWKKVDAPQRAFKQLADPFSLMNPGKLVVA